MLQTLRIRDFGLVDQIDLEFPAGFTCITGETGAGKSLLVNALAFVLGERAQAEWIRTGAETCEVSAVFLPQPGGPALAHLAELGIPREEVLILRRDFSRTGRGRVFINDRQATVQAAKQLGGFLCDLHGQHQHQWLLNPESHRHYLDRFIAGPLAGRYTDAFQEARRKQETLEALKRQIAQAREKREFWEYQKKELDAVNPQPHEDEELSARRERIRHKAELNELYLLAQAELDSADDSLSPRLADLASRMRKPAALDPDLAGWAARLTEARTLLDEVAREVALRLTDDQDDATRLDHLEERLHKLYKLKQRFGGSLEAAIAMREELASRLAQVEDADGLLRDLTRQADRSEATLAAAAEELIAARTVAAGELVRALRKPLAELGMGKDPIAVSQRRLDRARWQMEGPDEIEFLLSANPAEEPKPLARIASGGELSRVMLALKAVLPGQDRVGTLIFDEVDSGIGAVTGARVADLLALLSGGRQVIVITHLHPIAASADHHWVVSKRLVKGRHVPTVQALSRTERIEELGRLIAGGEATKESLAAARALVKTRGRD